MTPALKLNIAIFHFAYGGNGGIQSEHPDLREWELETVLKMKADPRVGEIFIKTISDTPITMTRNRAVRLAREAGAHALLFVDSDQSPNKHKGEPWFKPFWDVAFDELYNHYGKGPLCIGAPYCGPPPVENVYVFQFGSFASGHGDETKFSLDQYSRNEAAKMTGIQECAALPTGMILIDLRCFDLIEPSHDTKRTTLEKLQRGEITIDDAEWALRDGYFYYEWNDQRADQKASTEDVTCTRDMALAGMAKLGYNPVRCAWDSWVGHHKPWNVGKPQYYGVEQISANFRKACDLGQTQADKIIDAGKFTKLPPAPAVMVRPKFDWKTHHETPREDIAALEMLVKEVLAQKDTCRVLEVGSWLGGTAIPMADAGAQVHCIDTWAGTPTDGMGVLAEAAGSPDAVYAEFLKNIGHRYNKTIFPWRLDSLTAAKMDYPKKFDIIFIDADHSYEATKADIEAWLPHLAEDGIICGHDYGMAEFPGVKKAVHEIFGQQRTTVAWRPLNILGRTIWAVIPALEMA